jgi:peroxiredoxin (alkyl hydroperoxide reductase subunit C)|mmetsp:Transcript_11706/g.21105  ORF Transcript_11706/g.21105 Transcript_11706/m.21105 type:complete len:200 (-) Transcript_11706:85-684(-)|eukprot:CAMPEP_0177752976 /NCGR_PEP_ID=MMETSP0491_2-20121128/1204_1 /TAXON_ID=63592 /ORGANISM="Tetraselmis chuii, Strain PLY429" /LENGTH=199 /DNA_ID=CAMNT_0019268211 /DNA_START=110 /DNA_END=709 /DNA_ORIENTATION=-
MAECQIRKPAPEFSADAVVGGQLTRVSLSDYRGKYVVLFFYPADFTFVCPTEICAFSDSYEEFTGRDCEVLAISVDNKFSHLAWNNVERRNGGLGGCAFPMLSDITKSISRDYGCLIEEGEDAGQAFRALFIIDPNGTLRQKTINDLPVGRNVEEVLRLIDAFKFTDQHGEVCPANWRPGKKTMKDNPTDSKEYFSQLE